tara:strand:- start:1039 stop:1209 length:171 start_codon:yes stop_codon:yes gene_type:complete
MQTSHLQTLWNMWLDRLLSPSHIIKVIHIYGYELSYLTKQGIGVEKPGTKIYYKNK